MRKRQLFAAVVSFLCSPVVAQRASYAPQAAAQARPLPQVQRLERRFLQITASTLRLQAEAARLAQTRSARPAVQDLAQLVLARHESVQPEVLRLLHARSMAWPPPDPAHAKLLKRLAALNGSRFDRFYVEEVVLRFGQVDLANHEKLAAAAQDAVLRAWVQRQLPELRAQAARASRALPPGPVRGQQAL